MNNNLKKWNTVGGDPLSLELADRLSKQLEIPRLAAIALVNRGCTDEKKVLDFLNNSSIFLHDPFLLPNMRKACDIIIDSINKGEKICVYGDYDVDGVTSTALIYTYLKSKEADVVHYIPDRKTEGYGMNMTSVEHIAADGVKLIITVDNGITAVDEIAYAMGMGVRVVITDHHSCHEVIPSANAAVNPKISGCKYPFTELAGVGVAFKTVCAIESVLETSDGGDNEAVKAAIKELCFRYAELVAIGTIADVMPIRDENRLLCAMGLLCIDKNPSMPIDALMYMSSLGDMVSASPEYYMNKPRDVKKRKVTSSYIGFVLAPRINAAGRVTHANDALKLFLAETKKEAAEAAYALCGINNARKSMESAIFEEAVKILDEQDDNDRRIIVLGSDSWQHGVIGIVASRLLEKYGVPVILISFEDGMMTDERSPMDVGKGSCRSVNGFDIHKALDSCSDLFVRYGGHELAAGLTIYRKDLDEFTARVSDYAREHLDANEPATVLNLDSKAELSELTIELAEIISKFEPYGTDNEMPMFYSEDVTLRRLVSLSGGKYTKALFEKGGSEVSGLCFSCGPDAFPVFEGERADIAYSLEINEFRGVRSVQMSLEDVRMSKKYEAELSEKLALAERFILGEDAKFDGICPERKEFAALYGCVRNMCIQGKSAISLRRAASTIRTEKGIKLLPFEILIMLSVFDELSLISIEKVTDDIYETKLPNDGRKADLSESKLLDRYKRACNAVKKDA